MCACTAAYWGIPQNRAISDLPAGGILGQWVSHAMGADTDRVSVQWLFLRPHPQVCSRLSESPYNCWHAQHSLSQHEWAATSCRTTCYTIISTGFAFASHLVQISFQLDKMPQEPVYLAFLVSAPGTFQAWITDISVAPDMYSTSTKETEITIRTFDKKVSIALERCMTKIT